MAANVVLGLSWGCGCINDCQTSPADPATAGAARPRPAPPALRALLPGRAPARAAGPAVAGGHTCANAGRAAACTMGPAPRCTAARRAAASGGAFARAQAPRAGATALARPSSTSRAGRGWWSRRAPARASCPTPPSPGASSTRPPAQMPALFGAAAASRGTTVRARARRAPRARPAWPRPRQVTHSAQLRVCALARLRCCQRLARALDLPSEELLPHRAHAAFQRGDQKHSRPARVHQARVCAAAGTPESSQRALMLSRAAAPPGAPGPSGPPLAPILGTLVPAAVLAMLAAVLGLWWRRRRRRELQKLASSEKLRLQSLPRSGSSRAPLAADPPLGGRGSSSGLFPSNMPHVEEYTVKPSDFVVLQRKDGADWLLGQGAFGKARRAASSAGGGRPCAAQRSAERGWGRRATRLHSCSPAPHAGMARTAWGSGNGDPACGRRRCAAARRHACRAHAAG